MSGAERDNHNSKAYVAALRQIAEMRPDQGHEAIRKARKVLGMEAKVERWGCFEGMDFESSPHEGGCLIGTCEQKECLTAMEFAKDGKTKEDCGSWRKY